MNIFFYSRTCIDCANLMQLMKNSNILQNFNLYCVDDHIDELPPHITTVPTLIVGELKQQFVTSDAFKWVESVRFMNQRNMMEMNKKIIMANMIKQQQMMGPHGYTQLEMNGFSDNFAFKDVDHAQAHSFFTYGTENDNTIFTAPAEQNKNNGKYIGMSQQEQKIKLSEIESMRKEQDKQNEVYMKQNQINAVIESEKQKIREISEIQKNREAPALSRSQQLRMNGRR